jgi:hypothetical protein
VSATAMRSMSLARAMRRQALVWGARRGYAFHAPAISEPPTARSVSRSRGDAGARPLPVDRHFPPARG